MRSEWVVERGRGRGGRKGADTKGRGTGERKGQRRIEGVWEEGWDCSEGKGPGMR